MSRLPMLETQLVAAAAARRPRPQAPRRIALGLVAAACAAAAVLFLAPRQEREVTPAAAPGGVPAQTIELSHALTLAPLPAKSRIPHASLPSVAAETEARTPYPPGVRDDFDWSATSADPGAMSSVNDRSAVEFLVEYRSYCLWLKYWLAGGDRGGAATVIADIPRWPTQRMTEPYELRLQAAKVAAVQNGDVAPIQHEVDLNCSGV